MIPSFGMCINKSYNSVDRLILQQKIFIKTLYNYKKKRRKKECVENVLIQLTLTKVNSSSPVVHYYTNFF